MTYRELYRNSVLTLENNEIDDAEFEIRVLIQSCFGLSYTDYVMRARDSVDNERLPLFNELLNKRLQRIPLQYLIGEWDFLGRTFKVGEGVLIPRPETELLAEEIIEFCKKNNKTSPKIFDLCSGSGCIGLSLAKEIPNSEVWCVEISDDAFKYLTENKKLLSAGNADCIKGDILKGFESFGLPEPDIIVSNPPYICSSDIPGLQKEVQFEPKTALDGGEDGYIFYRALAEKWLPYINTGGGMFIECGEGQAQTISNLFKTENITETRIIRDFNEIERMVCAVRK